jgi:hypothetical protein
MKKVCAWCNSPIGSARANKITGPSQITHSICSDCADNLDFQLGVSLQRYLDSLKMPVVALNGNGSMIAVNVEAFRMHADSGKTWEGLAEWPDRIFECAHARLPGGCGSSIHCSGCAIRFIVTECYKTGKSISNVPAHFSHCDSGPPDKAELLVSADRVDKIVFLRMVKL